MDLSDAVAQYNARVSAAHVLPVSPAPTRQQRLSAAVDEAELSGLVSAATNEAQRAHLNLLQQLLGPS